METVDPVVPISTVIRRFENAKEACLQHRRQLPWWAFKQKAIILGAVACYDVEIEVLLALGGSCQPIIGQRT